MGIILRKTVFVYQTAVCEQRFDAFTGVKISSISYASQSVSAAFLFSKYRKINLI